MHESTPRRVLVAASISCCSKRRCAPIQSADQNIRPAGPPWRECALPGAEITTEKKSLCVRQHAPDFRRVSRVHLHRAAKMAHALRLLRAQQMAFERVRAHDLAAFRHSKALGGAAMRFQFANFWFCF